MKPIKRGKYYHIDLRWKGLPRIRISTRSTNKTRAQAMINSLVSLHSAGRYDLLGLLADGRVDFVELHEAFLMRGDELEQLRTKGESPELGPLVDEWLDLLKSPAGISPRTKRRIADQTIRRYGVSWAGFFEVLSRGRAAQLSDVTAGFISNYRRSRVRAHGGSSRNTAQGNNPPSAATINRDLTALKAFLRWCRESKQLTIPALSIRLEREPQGRLRWLSNAELVAVEQALPADWWPLFATLVHTGMRVGEAQGLRWADVNLRVKRISIHEEHRRVKSASSARDVPITEPLARILAQQSVRVPSEPADLVFPGSLSNYRRTRAAWRKACKRAGLVEGEDRQPNATIHDLRHTFGVVCAQAGIPLPRIQYLMGHASPHMTLRYMAHAPNSYFEADAAAIAQRLTPSHDEESQARTDLSRSQLRTA